MEMERNKNIFNFDIKFLFAMIFSKEGYYKKAAKIENLQKIEFIFLVGSKEA